MKTKKPKRKLINVTQHFINVGRRQSAACCPIALAAQHALKDVSIRYYGGEKLYAEHVRRYKVNYRRCSDFVGEFDRGRAVKPFKFYAELP